MKKRIVRITAALCAAALLAGCGSSIGSKDGGYYAAEATAQESYANYDSAAGSVDSGLVPENAAEAATDETAQKIIYNASLSMESTDFDTTREALMTAVEANGAWLESTSLYGTEKDHDRTADYTVRVPVGSYRAFLAAVGDAGSVLNISESAENITSSYIDVQARLSALEAQRDRLNALADQAETFQILRTVLSVSIELDRILISVLVGIFKSRLKCPRQSQIDRKVQQIISISLADRRRLIARSVIDDHIIILRKISSQMVHNPLYIFGFVVRRYDY